MTRHIMQPEEPKGGPDNDFKVFLWFVAGIGTFLVLVLEILRYG